MTICQLEEKTACFQKVESLTLLFISDSNDPVPKSKQTLRDHRELTLSAHVTVLPTVTRKSHINIDMKKMIYKHQQSLG